MSLKPIGPIAADIVEGVRRRHEQIEKLKNGAAVEGEEDRRPETPPQPQGGERLSGEHARRHDATYQKTS